MEISTFSSQRFAKDVGYCETDMRSPYNGYVDYNRRIQCSAFGSREFIKVDINFVDKRRSLGRYSSLSD
jgi:hypothetical protein